MNLPTIDFLGIGAQRAATTWLDVQLRNHPDVWMPPHKELHYFDRDPRYNSPSHLASENWMEGLIGNQAQDISWRRELKVNGARVFRRNEGPVLPVWQRLQWIASCYFGAPKDDNWYRSLFRHGEGKIKGEITPAYSLLNQKDIEHINQLFPEVKVIYLLRNPVERSLSQFLMQHGSPYNIPDEKIISFLQSPVVQERNNYLQTVARWTKVLGSKRLFIGWYEEVKNQPEELLHRLSGFLGLSRDITPAISASEAKNQSSGGLFSSRVIRALAKTQIENTAHIAEHFGGNAINWHEECVKLFNASESYVHTCK